MDAPSSTFFALVSSVPHEKAASPAPKLRQSPYSMPINNLDQTTQVELVPQAP
jgi:hypothetical protein